MEDNQTFIADSHVAVKIIKNAAKEQIMNEINGEKLSHPNIISTIKIEKLDDDVLILMEPWGSLNLQQLLSMSVKVPWEDILRYSRLLFFSEFLSILISTQMCSYSRQLALALDYCHSNGVLHLDVKPANIMVNTQKWIKLGDFGNSVSLQQLDSFQVTYLFPVMIFFLGCINFSFSINKE